MPATACSVFFPLDMDDGYHILCLSSSSIFESHDVHNRLYSSLIILITKGFFFCTKYFKWLCACTDKKMWAKIRFLFRKKYIFLFPVFFRSLDLTVRRLNLLRRSEKYFLNYVDEYGFRYPLGLTRDIQSVGKFLLQTSRACRGEWVDNFLNRNPCPETFRFRTAGTTNSK